MTDTVLAERRGRLGLISLNRPKALNALDVPMVDALDRNSPPGPATMRSGRWRSRGWAARRFAPAATCGAFGLLPTPAARQELRSASFRRSTG